MTDTAGTTCRSCGAKIFFAKTTKSQSVPFDAAPQHIYGMDEQGVMQHLGKGHVCHFATCPSREQHRKPAANTSTVDRSQGKPAAPPPAAPKGQGALYGPANPSINDVFPEDEE